MKYLGPATFLKAVQALSILPGVGEKTAQRLIFSLMKNPQEKIPQLSQALVSLMNNLKHCSNCFGYTEAPKCPICTDPSRDQSMICVVEDPTNIFAIEKSGQFQGVYHVLNGVLAPLDGIGPDQLTIAALLERIAQNDVVELILATSPTVEGDATAMFISQKLKESAVRLTRIAQGVPTGGSLEYIDQYTLGRAITDRRIWS